MWVTGAMSDSIRRELDLARLAARERRLRLVMQILGARHAETERAGVSAPDGLRHSISDFGQQLRDVHRRQADLDRLQGGKDRAAQADGERTDRFARRAVTPPPRRSLPD